MRWPWERVPWGRGRGADASDSAAGDADSPSPGSADPPSAEPFQSAPATTPAAWSRLPPLQRSVADSTGDRAAGRVPFLADHAPEPELPRPARAPGRSATVRSASSAGWPRRSAARSRTRVWTSSASPSGRHPSAPAVQRRIATLRPETVGAAPRGRGRTDVQRPIMITTARLRPATWTTASPDGDRTRSQRAGGTRDPAVAVPSSWPARRNRPCHSQPVGRTPVAPATPASKRPEPARPDLGAGDSSVSVPVARRRPRKRDGSGVQHRPVDDAVDRSGPAIGYSVGIESRIDRSDGAGRRRQLAGHAPAGVVDSTERRGPGARPQPAATRRPPQAR